MGGGRGRDAKGPGRNWEAVHTAGLKGRASQSNDSGWSGYPAPPPPPPPTCVVITRPLPWWRSTRSTSDFSTTASEVVRPGASTLVESDMKSVTPSRPAKGG